MALQAGIVGLPNVGKSTLFNALTSGKAQSANFPFCTIEPNVGIISVPDERLDALAKIWEPGNVIPTVVEIVDIAGLVKGASKGEGLGNQFLGNIRDVDAIIHVVRCFDDPNVIHVDGSVDPVRDKEIIDMELLFKDLDTVEKRIEKQSKMAKSGDKDMIRIVEELKRLKAHLEAGRPARSFARDEDEKERLRDLHLLTNKPILYLANVEEAAAAGGNEHVEKLKKAIEGENAELLVVSAAIEAEIAELDTEEERKEFLVMMGLEEPGLYRLIRATYRLLDLITFFTAGEKEVRAWTVRRGAKAPEAAGVIHSDFQKGFIRAEVISFDDYIHYGSEAAAKEAGRMRLEGKEYIVQDGDVMHFRFNV